MGVSTIEIAIIRQQRGIDAGAALWRLSTADLWFIAEQVGAIVKRRSPSKEELVNAILAITHPAPPLATSPAPAAEQTRMF